MAALNPESKWILPTIVGNTLSKSDLVSYKHFLNCFSNGPSWTFAKIGLFVNELLRMSAMYANLILLPSRAFNIAYPWLNETSVSFSLINSTRSCSYLLRALSHVSHRIVLSVISWHGLNCVLKLKPSIC